MSKRCTEAELAYLNSLIVEGRQFQPATAHALVAEIRLSWQERDQWKHATEVWQRRYQDLVMEPLPRLLYRRLAVGVARVIGGRWRWPWQS